jgi:anhydro-N-acetylmuramic acid kinase
MHGQTVFHEAAKATWQLGEAAVVRERLGVPVVSDFRSADVAAGGQGAPLVPMLDFCMYRSKTKNRVLLNLGGIANVTAIPAGAALADVLAFDTGPANMAIDAVMQSAFGKPFDRGGKVAVKGRVLTGVVSEVLRDPYFAAPPPKSCGREQFGAAFVERFRGLCANAGAEDAVATATELTASSVLDAYGRFCWPHLGQRAPLARATEVIVAGGGVKNATLMRRLREGFGGLGVNVSIGEEPQAKEAVAFALLAWLSWHRMPGNVPSATGATAPKVLGKVCW